MEETLDKPREGRGDAPIGGEPPSRVQEHLRVDEARRADLRKRLAGMQPTDGLERSHLRRMLTLLSSPSDPCAREHFTPGHFTASAFVLNPAQDSLLLIFHGKLARWLQPGGHVDPADMDVLAAARRELSEEVGLSDLPLVRPAIFDVDVHDIPARGRTPVHAHFDVRFLFQAHDEGCRAGSDAQDARWFRLDEIDAALSDPSVLRAVRKILTAP